MYNIYPKGEPDVGRNFKIGYFNMIYGGVSFGDDCEVKNYAEIRDNIRFGHGCYIDSGVRFSGDCVFGNRVVFRFNALIGRNIKIGDDTFISPNVIILYQTHKREAIKGGVRIGKGCFIGTSAVITPGVTIADGITVGALSYVNKDLSEPGSYVGSPAKLRPR